MYVEKKRTSFLALPIYFTTYTISDEKVTTKSGLISTVEDDCYIYKIQDVKLIRSLFERIFELGTIICYTGDTTDPELRFEHIKHAAEIKEFLLKQSEEERIKRRTLHTVGIDAEQIEEDMDSYY